MSARVRSTLDPLREFLHEEAAGGVALLMAAVIALVWANSPAGDEYVRFWHTEVAIAGLDLDLQHWVNDGLMALFFFVVGLEIKRELSVGELRDRRAAALPAIAAAGGVALPALIFTAIAAGSPAVHGWAIPAATDIAFAVGIIALLGRRVPAGARLFLLAIAIIDDIIAIAIIALFYSESISLPWLGGAVAGLALVVAMRRLGVDRTLTYVPVGLAVWLAVHESGVHATIAGVALGLLTPAAPIGGRNVLATLEHRLHPISAFVVVPLFALANAGVDFGDGLLGRALESRVTWAVVIGLLVGKLVGISAATLLALRLRLGALPEGVRTGHVFGVAALGGIGFTVSIFIAGLAYDDPVLVDGAKIGILLGSIVGALGGSLLLWALGRTRE